MSDGIEIVRKEVSFVERKPINCIEKSRVPIVSLNVNIAHIDTAIEHIVSMARGGEGGYVCFSTVHMIMESYDNDNFRATVNAADLVVPDGMPLVWMQKLQGVRNAGIEDLAKVHGISKALAGRIYNDLHLDGEN